MLLLERSRSSSRWRRWWEDRTWCCRHQSEPVLDKLVAMVRDWVSPGFCLPAAQLGLAYTCPQGFVTSPGHSPSVPLSSKREAETLCPQRGISAFGGLGAVIYHQNGVDHKTGMTFPSHGARREPENCSLLQRTPRFCSLPSRGCFAFHHRSYSRSYSHGCWNSRRFFMELPGIRAALPKSCFLPVSVAFFAAL